MLDRAEGQYEFRSGGPSLNGPRCYRWAMLSLEPENHFLLLRKPEAQERGGQEKTRRADAGKESHVAARGTSSAPAGNLGKEKSGDKVKDEGITFCLCYVPENSPVKPTMTNMVMMSRRRWGVEDKIATAKGPIGLDENQFRQLESMQHHTALAGLAMLRANIIRERLGELPAASGTVMGKRQRQQTGNEGDSTREDSAALYSANQRLPEEIGYIRLSVNEILRLVGIADAEMSEARMAFHIAWSKSPRKHQAIARWYRMRCRMKAEQGALINLAFAGAATLCNRSRVHSSNAGVTGAMR